MPPRRTAPGSARSSDNGTRRMSAAASEADTGASVAEGLIGATRAEAARGRSGCHRPEKITCAAGLIEVKTVRVHDQRVEGRPQAVVALAAVVPHVPGPGQMLRLLRPTACHRGTASAPGSSAARSRGSCPLPSRGFRQWQAGHPRAGPSRVPAAYMGGHGCAGPKAYTSTSAGRRPKPTPGSFSRRADGFRKLVTLTPAPANRLRPQPT